MGRIDRIFDIAAPPAASMIEAMRGVGYSLPTAIADIVDNSIAAKSRNIWLNFWWAGRESFISILDDGSGMIEHELITAMCPGSKNPLDERAENDLGRFGLGLKTASFSQCRSLTVASAVNKTIAIRRWDIDHVTAVNEWQLLRSVSPGSEQRLATLRELKHGTLVLLEKLDRVTGDTSLNDQRAHNSFLYAIDRVEQHLAMVFHRFLEGANPNLNIFINGTLPAQRVKAWDPFMQDNTFTDHSPLEHIYTPSGTVELQGHVLPHKDRLDTKSFEIGAGPEGWTSQQGFYVYRNRRMLVSGSWLGLGFGRAWTKEEPYKLARIRLDITNSADSEWKIDIRKSVARPPDYLRYRLRDLAERVRTQARSVFAHRGTYGKRAAISGLQRAWEINTGTNEKVTYRVSRNHPLVKAVLDESGGLRDKVESMLRVIEGTVPVQQIWLDTVEKGEIQDDLSLSSSEDEVCKILRTIYDHMVRQLKITPSEARNRLALTEPFHNYPRLIESLKG